MKTGIIGLPQVGKTSLFRILTKAKVEDRGYSREAHLGIAKVPDDRLEKLAALYDPKKDHLCDGRICRCCRDRAGSAQGNVISRQPAQCRRADSCAARI